LRMVTSGSSRYHQNDANGQVQPLVTAGFGSSDETMHMRLAVEVPPLSRVRDY